MHTFSDNLSRNSCKKRFKMSYSAEENTYFGFFCLQVDGPVTRGRGVEGAYKEEFTVISLPKNQTLLYPASEHVVLFGHAFKRC